MSADYAPWLIGGGLAALAYYGFTQGWFTATTGTLPNQSIPATTNPQTNTQNQLPANVMALSDQAAYQAWATQQGLTFAQIQANLAAVQSAYTACQAPWVWSPTVVPATDLPQGCLPPPPTGTTIAPGGAITLTPVASSTAISGLGKVTRRHIHAARWRHA